MSIKAASVAFALLVSVAPLAAADAQPVDPPVVRLKASAQLTPAGSATDRATDRWFEGRLVSSDPGSITLAMTSAGDPARLQVPRWAIVALEVYRGKSRGGPLLIGAAAGLGAGFVWGATAASGCSDRGGLCQHASWIVPPMITLPIGAIIGAAVGRARWEPVEIDTLAPVVP